MQKNVDAVLVDDDVWIRDRWSRQFGRHGKQILIYRCPSEFIRASDKLNRETPLFFDYRFPGNKRNGSELAALALQKGFRRIYISSHHGTENLSLPPQIFGVIGKEPPTWLLRKNEKSLNPDRKKEIFKRMTSEEKEIFRKRMTQLYESRFASADVYLSPSHPEEKTFSEWENAIYLGHTDEQIQTIVHGQNA